MVKHETKEVTMNIQEKIASEFSLTDKHTENIISLLDEGNTIPFIARYRKEMTGNINDQVLRDLSDRLNYLRNLQKRKEEIAASITEQGKMTDEILSAIEQAATMTEAEDIYLPFKKKKKTRAGAAIEKGLQPLADSILAQKLTDLNAEAKKYLTQEVKTEKEALQGAMDIIAEICSDNAVTRKKLRNLFLRNGVISSSYARGKKDAEGAEVYETYAEYSESVATIKEHRVLALNRGENEGFLKVKIEVNEKLAVSIVSLPFLHSEGVCADFIKKAAEDSYSRLLQPSIEREVRSLLTEKANEASIHTFEENLRSLLLQPPVKNKVTLGWDPGYRTGCKICVVDGTGKVLDKTVVYPVPPHNRVEEAKAKIKKLMLEYGVELIAVGNGTASKESEIFVSDLLKEMNSPAEYMMVSEAGASVYSASELACEEFPDYDVTERSAVSIARRLQDPLAELIKINPKSIGVGQYQHDMDQKKLDEALDGVLESCVNSVGVDLNTASVSLLKYVAGLNSAIAKNIVAYREQNGRFISRRQLLKVSKLGEKAFTQCAGFLRIEGGENILDNTAVHPESYEKARKLLTLAGYTEKDVEQRRIGDFAEKIKSFGFDRAEKECELDKATMLDIIEELKKPGRDIRELTKKPKLRRDVLSLEDLKPGMEITGTVRNVVDFGAFVDIGVHQDGLLHISQIANKFVKKASDALKVGQIVDVRVLEVDVRKKRIALTMKKKA